MTKPLSPAAAAVLRVVNAAPHCGSGRIKAAAALRAAADAGRRGPDHWQGNLPDDFDKGWEEALDWMAWVAAELEAQ